MATNHAMMRTAAMLLAVALGGVTRSAAQFWNGGPPLNSARGFADAVVDPCGNIWVFFGIQRFSGGPATVLNSIEVLRFDGENYADHWEISTPVLPTPRAHHTAVCVNNFIYLIGGHDQSGQYVSIIDRYDLITETWDTLPSELGLSPARIDHASVVDRAGRMWVIGGVTDGNFQATNSAIMFDPARPALGWQTGPVLSAARSGLGAVVDQHGRIWAMGGADSSTHLTIVERLDACAITWQTFAVTLPTPASNFVAAAFGSNGSIYAAGGWLPGYSSDVFRIDMADDVPAWAPVASLGLARNEHSLVLGFDDRLYAIGGESGGVSSQSSVETLRTRRCLGDLNAEGTVDLADLAILLSRFGSVCP